MLDKATTARAMKAAWTTRLQPLVAHDCFVVHLRLGDKLVPKLVGGDTC